MAVMACSIAKRAVGCQQRPYGRSFGRPPFPGSAESRILAWISMQFAGWFVIVAVCRFAAGAPMRATRL